MINLILFYQNNSSVMIESHFLIMLTVYSLFSWFKKLWLNSIFFLKPSNLRISITFSWYLQRDLTTNICNNSLGFNFFWTLRPGCSWIGVDQVWLRDISVQDWNQLSERWPLMSEKMLNFAGSVSDFFRPRIFANMVISSVCTICSSRDAPTCPDASTKAWVCGGSAGCPWDKAVGSPPWSRW